MSSAPQPVRVFSPVTLWSVFGFFACGQFIQLIGLIYGFDLSNVRWWWQVIIFVIWGLVLFLLALNLRRTKLVILSNGLEYRSMWGYSAFAQWSNLTHYREFLWVRGHPVYLHAKHVQLRGPRLARQWAKFTGEAWAFPLSQFMLINLGFASTEIGGIVREYAPWVFAEGLELVYRSNPRL
jgi:hypothetical protein